MKKSILLGPLFLLTLPVMAKTFSTDFIRMELPEGWSCAREEIDYVCQPESLKQRSEAMVVVVVKSVNEVDDTLPKYEQVLKEGRDMMDLSHKPYKSQVKYTLRKKIKDREWVDSLHLGSEIPGFYTRYLASINDKVAGLVTYSIAESVFPKYAQVLEGMVGSLELKFDPKAYEKAMSESPSSLLPKGASFGGPKRFAPPTLEPEDLSKKSEPSGLDPMQIGVVLAIAAAIGFLIWKRSKKG